MDDETASGVGGPDAPQESTTGDHFSFDLTTDRFSTQPAAK
jgi:hypothetical protein